jgi:hypothetical protein
MVRAEGERSIGVGRDVIKSILVTGDHNQVFVGDYVLLRDAYIDPWPVFRRVRLERFIGRDWLMAEIDEFVDGSASGYFILEAQAGLGKTAFLAHLVRERGYVHHFVELARGPDGILPALQNLAAQLVRAYQLVPYDTTEVLPGSAARPGFLAGLLRRSASGRREKLVVVVDGLDEAGTPPGQNVLGLPEILPEGVFFVVSQRPVQVSLRIEGPRRVLRLDADGPENVNDVGQFLNHVAASEWLVRRLRRDALSTQAFVSAMLAKSRGLWVYLHYVLAELEQEPARPLDLSALPDGLWQYYAGFWERWRAEHDPDWFDWHLPTLATLAAAAEDLPVSSLATLSGAGARPRLGRLLDETWRPFIAVRNGEGRRYGLYHASLREFVEGRVDEQELTSSQQVLAHEFADATKQAHHRIADRYLVAWGGLETELARVHNPADRDLDGRYGLHHLATHLARAGRATELHRLLSLPTNTWYAVHEEAGETPSYIIDIALGWRVAEEDSARLLRRREPASSIGLEIRYALMNSSINSLGANLPAALIDALVDKDVWSSARALSYARTIYSGNQRSRALALLANRLSGQEEGEVYREALATARNIADRADRARALSSVTAALPTPLREAAIREAIAVTSDVANEAVRADVFMAICRQLSPGDPILPELMTAVRGMRIDRERFSVLRHLAPLLPNADRSALSAEVRQQLTRLSPTDYRIALALLALCAPENERRVLITEALDGDPHRSNPSQFVEQDDLRPELMVMLAPVLPDDMMRDEIPSEKQVKQKGVDSFQTSGGYGGGFAERTVFIPHPIQILASLAPRVPRAKLERLLPPALDTALAIQEPAAKAHILCDLIPLLTQAQLLSQEELRRIVQAIATVRDYDARDRLAENLAPRLSPDLLREALAATRRISDEEALALAQVKLAVHLLGPSQRQALGKGRESAMQIRDDNSRSWALAQLVAAWPENERGDLAEDALSAAELARATSRRSLYDEQHRRAMATRAEVLAAIAPHLPERQLERAFKLALAEELDNGFAKDDDIVLWDEASLLALEALAPSLPQSLARKAAEGTRFGFDDDIDDISVIAVGILLPRLEGTHKTRALQAALKAARSMEDQAWSTSGFSYYPQGQVLATLTPHMSEDERAETLTQLLTAALELPIEADRNDELPLSEALNVLAPYLSPELAKRALDELRRMGQHPGIARALLILSPYLSEREREDARRFAAEFGDTDTRVMAAIALAADRYGDDRKPRVQGLIELLEMEQGDDDPWTGRLHDLAQLMLQMPGDQANELWRRLTPKLALRDREALLKDILELAPLIAHLGGTPAVHETCRAIDDVARWWP